MSEMSRRGFLGIVAAGAAAVVSPGLSASAVEMPRQSLVAVRVFPTYRNKVYADHAAVLSRLGDLGIKRISHKITPSMGKDVVTFTQRAYEEHGIKSWLTVGEPNVVLTPAQWDEIVGLLTGPLAGMVDLVAGYNEPNNGGPSDWATRSVNHNRELFRRLEGVIPKIGTPQLWSGNLTRHDNDLALLKRAGLAGSFNTFAWHLYPRGGVGVNLIDRFESTYRSTFGDFPIICTEAGYSTPDLAAYTGGARIVSEADQAKLLPQLVEAYVARGHGISYFEMLDDPDPTGGNREAHFGLWHTPALDPATWSTKPAFSTFKAKIASYA